MLSLKISNIMLLLCLLKVLAKLTMTLPNSVQHEVPGWTLEERACSTVGKCAAFCAGGPQFDSQ